MSPQTWGRRAATSSPASSSSSVASSSAAMMPSTSAVALGRAHHVPPQQCQRRGHPTTTTTTTTRLVPSPRLLHLVAAPSEARRRIAASSSHSIGAADDPWLPPTPSQHARWYSLSSPYDREIASIALPAMCAMLMDPIVGSINSAFIGQIGTMELGAVSIGSLAVSFNTLLFSFLVFLTIPEIAAAVSKKDSQEVSKVASKSLWLAAVCGLLTCTATVLGAEGIVSYLKPAEPAVAQYAVEYIRVRAFGIIPTLITYVATAVFRGHKDTKTPLVGAFAAASCSLSLSVLFIQVLHWGVFGSALASAMASTVACLVMCSQMLRQGQVLLPDLLRPPSLQSLLPMLRSAVPLVLRTVISFGMVLYASSLCVRAGSVYQASFEVIRQAWTLTLSSFECLNVATQVLCASYLGSGHVAAARSTLLRVLFLGVCVGALAGTPLYVFKHQFAHTFSSDPAVIHQVLMTLPVVALFVPLDAVGSIMDGSLVASKQTDFLSLIQIVCAGFQFLALAYVTQNGLTSCLTVWGCLKLMTVFRVAGGFGRSLLYPKSPYMVPAVAAAAAVAVAVGGAAAEVKGAGSRGAVPEPPQEDLNPGSPLVLCSVDGEAS